MLINVYCVYRISLVYLLQMDSLRAAQKQMRYDSFISLYMNNHIYIQYEFETFSVGWIHFLCFTFFGYAFYAGVRILQIITHANNFPQIWIY